MNYVIHQRVQVLHQRFQTDRETDENTRPMAECFYCFEVFGTSDETWSTSCWYNFSKESSEQRALDIANESLFFARKCEKPVPTSRNCFKWRKFHSAQYLLSGRCQRILFTSSPRSSPLRPVALWRVFILRWRNWTLLDHEWPQRKTWLKIWRKIYLIIINNAGQHVFRNSNRTRAWNVYYSF